MSVSVWLLWEACMRWIRACNSAYVSECIMALCMIISNDSTIPPCWLLLSICRGEIISFHVSRNKNFHVCGCAVSFPLFYLNWWIVYPFGRTDVSTKLYLIVCVVPGVFLITRKARTSESKNIIGTPQRILSAQCLC